MFSTIDSAEILIVIDLDCKITGTTMKVSNSTIRITNLSGWGI
ncbi:MAG: hypothetical protein ACJATE_002049 [Bacteroidia bacterium]|jgi:hypothetical protein